MDKAFSAIVGIGGGTMTTPFLTYNKVDIKNAIATSAAVGMPIAIAGSGAQTLDIEVKTITASAVPIAVCINTAS
jgi:uncharacterized membrane protein YfcA